jgi:hypothetical protein
MHPPDALTGKAEMQTGGDTSLISMHIGLGRQHDLAVCKNGLAAAGELVMTQRGHVSIFQSLILTNLPRTQSR